jgi:hypothetical protein
VRHFRDSLYRGAKENLQKWFNFSEDSLSFLLSKLKLNHEISFSESACVSKMPKNMNLHMDALFDEFRAGFTNVS